MISTAIVSTIVRPVEAMSSTSTPGTAWNVRSGTRMRPVRRRYSHPGQNSAIRKDVERLQGEVVVSEVGTEPARD